MIPPVIYIGKNETHIARLGQLLSEPPKVFATYVAAGEYMGKTKVRRAVVCFEKDNTELDSLGIKFLKTNFKSVYVILITSPLTPEERKIYLRSGVNDTIPDDVTTERLNEYLDFLSQNLPSILQPVRQEAKQAHVFHMPWGKRLFDIVCSLGALIVLSPLMLAVAAAIRIESKGPVVYKSKRAGSNFQVFDFLKFRSMYTDADKKLKEFKDLNQYAVQEKQEEDTHETAPLTGDMTPDALAGMGEVMLISDDFVISEPEFMSHNSVEQQNAFVKFENDPRITRVGQFIRKYSIDELPQLVNILRGDMSVVGNRPLPLYEAELLTNDEYIDRFMAPSGLTGLWQVEKRGEAGKLSAEERKQLDITYAKQFSPMMDLRIILKTLGAFIQKENV